MCSAPAQDQSMPDVNQQPPRVCHVCLDDCHPLEECKVFAQLSTRYGANSEHCAWCLAAYDKSKNRHNHYFRDCVVPGKIDQPKEFVQLARRQLTLLGFPEPQNAQACPGCRQVVKNMPKHIKSCAMYELTLLPDNKQAEYHKVAMTYISLKAGCDEDFKDALREARPALNGVNNRGIDARAIYEYDPDRDQINNVPECYSGMITMSLDAFLSTEFSFEVLGGLHIPSSVFPVQELVNSLKARPSVQNGDEVIVVMMSNWSDNMHGCKKLVDSKVFGNLNLHDDALMALPNGGYAARVVVSDDKKVVQMRTVGRTSCNQHMRATVHTMATVDNREDPMFYKQLASFLGSEDNEEAAVILLTDMPTCNGKIGASTADDAKPRCKADEMFEKSFQGKGYCFTIICAPALKTKCLPNNFAIWIPKKGLHMSSLPWMVTEGEYNMYPKDLKKKYLLTPPCGRTHVERAQVQHNILHDSEKYHRADYFYDYRVDLANDETILKRVKSMHLSNDVSAKVRKFHEVHKKRLFYKAKKVKKKAMMETMGKAMNTWKAMCKAKRNANKHKTMKFEDHETVIAAPEAADVRDEGDNNKTLVAALEDDLSKIVLDMETKNQIMRKLWYTEFLYRKHLEEGICEEECMTTTKFVKSRAGVYANSDDVVVDNNSEVATGEISGSVEHRPRVGVYKPRRKNRAVEVEEVEEEPSGAERVGGGGVGEMVVISETARRWVDKMKRDLAEEDERNEALKSTDVTKCKCDALGRIDDKQWDAMREECKICGRTHSDFPPHTITKLRSDGRLLFKGGDDDYGHKNKESDEDDKPERILVRH